MRLFGFLGALWFLLAVSAVPAADDMRAFPAAEGGMVRYVLQLPKQGEESDFKVELIVGKTVDVDERNRYFFAGRIEEETIKGWGFPRYVVSPLGPMAGTLMAIDPDAALEEMPREHLALRSVPLRAHPGVHLAFPSTDDLVRLRANRKSVV